MQGACGSVELAACCLAIRDNIIPPTINYEFPDPDCDLDFVPNVARHRRVNVAVSNSLGFGGRNTSLVIERIGTDRMANQAARTENRRPMKTALLLTNSAETQRLLTDILGEKTNIVLLPAAVRAVAGTIRLPLLDLAAPRGCGHPGRRLRWRKHPAGRSIPWKDRSLQEHQAVIVRVTDGAAIGGYMPAGWLLVSDSDSPERLKQALGTFFELRDAQSKLKRVDAVIARQRQVTGPPAINAPQARSMMSSSGAFPSFDAYRYRDALKDLSRILSQYVDEGELLSEFLRLVRELLGVGKVGIFTRRLPGDLFTGQSGAGNRQFSAARCAGIAQHLSNTCD